MSNAKESIFAKIDAFMADEFTSNSNFGFKMVGHLRPATAKPAKAGPGIDTLAEVLMAERRKQKPDRQYRTYEELQKAIETRIRNKDYFDLVTREKVKRTGLMERAERERILLLTETFSSVESDEEDQELLRLDFTESILFSQTNQFPGQTYWYIVKLLHYLRICNSNGSLICLLALQHFLPKTNEIVQAFEDSKGVSLLLNLLSADEFPIRIASMIVLFNLTRAAYFIRVITFFDSIPSLVGNLRENEPEIRRYACLILANLCLFHEARRKLREHWGLHMLLCLLDELTGQVVADAESEKTRVKNWAISRANSSQQNGIHAHWRCPSDAKEASDGAANSLLVAIATALWRASRSRRNRQTLLHAGLVCILRSLLHVATNEVRIPLTGLLHNCSADEQYRVAIAAEEMLPTLLRQMSAPSILLKSYSALTLYRCSAEDSAQKAFMKGHTIDMLHGFLSQEVHRPDGALALILSRSPDQVHDLTQEDMGRFKCSKASIEPSRGDTKKRTRFALPFTSDEPVGKLYGHTEPLTPGRTASSGVVKAVVHVTGPRASVNKGQKRLSLIQHERDSLDHAEDRIKYLHSLTGVIAKLAENPDNARAFHRLGTTDHLLRILSQLSPPICAYVRPTCSASDRLNGLEWSEKIIRNSIEALDSLTRVPVARTTIAEHPKSIFFFTMLLRQGPSCLVASVCNSLIELMQEPTVLSQFCQLDGLRLLALHASKGHHTTRIAAIRALHSCVRRNQETGRLLKPLIGFLHDLVNLCRSNAKDQDAEHATCCVIAEVAKNPRCLAVLTDLGVLGLIEQLIPRAETDQMKAALASAISSCAVYGSNTEVLGRPKNIQYLLGYLKTTNRETLAETIRAFCVLSRSPKVARHIYEAGISKVLLKMIGSADVELQAAVAMAIRNINKLNQMDDHFLDKLASQQVFKGTPGNSEEALLITKAAASIKAI